MDTREGTPIINDPGVATGIVRPKCDSVDLAIGPRNKFPIQTPGDSSEGSGQSSPVQSENMIPPTDKTVVSFDIFTPFDAFLTVLAMVGYIFDLGSDVFVAFMHYRYKNYWWFGLTVSFMVLPSVTVASFSLTWYIQDRKTPRGKSESRPRWVIRYIFVFLQLAPLMRLIDMLVYGIREMQGGPSSTLSRLQQEKRQCEATDSALLRLFKSFMEAAPQFTLQLYILILEGIEENVVYEIGQAVSCTTSLCSLSWSLVVYQKTLRSVLLSKRQLTYRAMVPMFLWHVFTIGARVISLALFASSFSYWICTVVGCHWCIMFVWIFLQKNELCDNSIGEFLFKIIAAVVHIYCFFNLCSGRTRLRYAIFYALVYVENMAMMVTWYSFRPTESPWYVLPAMVFVLGLFFVGIAFQVVYYIYCHPNNGKTSKQKIPLCVPFNELKSRTVRTGMQRLSSQMMTVSPQTVVGHISLKDIPLNNSFSGYWQIIDAQKNLVRTFILFFTKNQKLWRQSPGKVE